jgi:argininosuccinate lyase
LWGGRASGGSAEALGRLAVSVHVDWRLAPYALAASRAHARMLHRAGLLDDDDRQRILVALDELDHDARYGLFKPTSDDADVHTALERGLLERLGGLADKLRAGHSRNEQAAVALRLYLRDHVRRVALAVTDLADALLGQASAHAASPSPGLVQLQHAQPVVFGHHLLAHVQALLRDLGRLRDWDVRAAVSPIGAGTLAGTSLPVDPVAAATELGFGSVADNSVDAVADRDFAAEFLFAAALVGVHLSRMGEEVVLWTTREFGWVELDDAFTTGSPVVPQRRNPDVAELTRAKSGRLVGDLASLLVTLKGLPLAYGRDLDEAAEPVFDAIDTLLLVLPAMAGAVQTMRVDVERLASAAAEGFSLATGVAEHLVGGGVPYREAYEVAGHLVMWCTVNECSLEEVSDDDLARISPRLTPDVRVVLSVRGALAARTAQGGTAPARVAEQIAAAASAVRQHRAWATSGT